MKKIIITDLEAEAGRSPIIYGSGDKVNRIESKEESLMRQANEKAGIKDNLLWHGWKMDFSPEKEQYIFSTDSE